MISRTIRTTIALAVFLLAASSLAAAQTPDAAGNIQRLHATLNGLVFVDKNRTTDAVERVGLAEFEAAIARGRQAKGVQVYDVLGISVEADAPFVVDHGKFISGLGVKRDELPGQQQNLKVSMLSAGKEQVTVSVQFNDRPAVTVELRTDEVGVIPVGPLDRKVNKPAYLALRVTGIYDLSAWPLPAPARR